MFNMHKVFSMVVLASHIVIGRGDTGMRTVVEVTRW
jgi:hypothetical protein